MREALLYSEKRPRDLLFDIVERIVTTPRADELMVVTLTREAATQAAGEARSAGIEFANWTTAAMAVVRAMLGSESLLDERGRPIPTGVTANAARVGGLVRDFRDRTEAFLLEFLLQRLGDVRLRDHTALAHALFRQFDRRIPVHTLEERVAILVARLADRVTLEGDRYVACPQGVSPPPAYDDLRQPRLLALTR
jgi:hypothetical protein